MTKQSKLLSLALFAAAWSVPAEAVAKNFLDLRIPASACRPTNADRAKVKLQDGTWVFVSGVTAKLICPVHLWHPLDLPDSNFMDAFRLWYQDQDGTSLNRQVRAQLFRRASNTSVASAVAGAVIASNSSSDMMYQRLLVDIDHTADFFGFTYFVEIDMFRASEATSSPVFVGLDFTNNLPM